MSYLITEIQDRVAVVTINRPAQLNALNAAVLQELHEEEQQEIEQEVEEEIAYHGTTDDITEFHPLSHFGTEKAAKDRMTYKKIKDGKIYKVDLDIKNPLTIKDFPGIHYDRLYAFELRDKKLISQKEIEELQELEDTFLTNPEKRTTPTKPVENEEQTKILTDFDTTNREPNALGGRAGRVQSKGLDYLMGF